MEEPDRFFEYHAVRALDLIKGKWTLQILCSMEKGPVRLSQLRRSIPQASKKSLTASLRGLESARVVVRNDLSHSVLHVEYELASAMKPSILSLLGCLSENGRILTQTSSDSVAPHVGAKP